MENLVILDISKIAIQYYCNDLDGLSEKGYVGIECSVSLDELDNDNSTKIATVKFDLLLSASELPPDIKENVDAKLSFTYKMVFETSKKLEDVIDADVLNFLEPYIRKEVYDYYNEVGLPPIPLTYRFWEHAESN